MWTLSTAGTPCTLGSPSLLRRVVVYPAAAFTLSMILLRFRVLPDVLNRGWFAANLLVSIASAHVLMAAAQLLEMVKLIDKPTAERLCTQAASVTFKWSRYTSAHIDIKYSKGSLAGGFDDVATPSVVMLNHTSFMDPITYFWIVNNHFHGQSKTFYKEQLARIPVVGKFFFGPAHFPVYFLTDRGDEFRVQKDKQAAVFARFCTHLDNKGSIHFCPEGAVNRQNLRELQPFRSGLFQPFIQHRLPLYFYLTVGNDKVWRQNDAIGGHSATIYVYIGKIIVDYNAANLDANVLAELVRNQMQQRLDEMYKEIDSAQLMS